MTTVLDIKSPTACNGPVIVTDVLAEEDLRDLIEARVLAVQVASYYDEDYSHLLSQRLLRHPLFGRYANAPDIGRVGMAYFETMNNPDLRRRYYAEASNWIESLRAVCAPFQSPMDKFRLQLQERWSAGASLENIEDAPMFVGLARVFENGAGAYPHQDVLGRDAPEGCSRARSLLTQLSANIYLRPSLQGGELEIWGIKPTDEEYEMMRRPGCYGIDRDLLPEPDVVLSPRTGDLILFDANRLHAVRPAFGGPRVTMSCFIGYRGLDQALTFWS